MVSLEPVVKLPLEIHLLLASGRLKPHFRAIEDQVARAFEDVGASLELGEAPVDVVVRDAPRAAIPELGIGGVAPDRHTIFVNVDPSHPRIDQTIGSELHRTVAHELHHIARRRAGQRGTTLWAAIVHEGLADHFAAELYGGPPPLWSTALTPDALDALVGPLDAERNSDSYDHAVWFYGRDPEVAPRWAGYAIGWRVVGDYLRRRAGAKASQLAGLSADAFREP